MGVLERGAVNGEKGYVRWGGMRGGRRQMGEGRVGEGVKRRSG